MKIIPIIYFSFLCLLMTKSMATSSATITSSFSTFVSTASIPSIKWQDCVKEGQVGFECASINVPLDYAHPRKYIRLALIRHLAESGKKRLGSLFFNPGGPGGSGRDDLPRWFELFPKIARERFDIVSWDPRGVGASTSVQCFNNQDEEDQFFKGIPLGFFPYTRALQERWIDHFRSYAKICKQRNGALLNHLSTTDTALDLELLRLALHEPSMNYLGVSYGTLLGAVYANLFPQHVRAMIFDGNIDPNAYFDVDLSTSMRLGSDTAVAKSLEKFITLCGKTSEANCAFSAGTGYNTQVKFNTLLKNLKKNPVILSGQSIDNAKLLAMMNAYLFTGSAQACDKSGDNCAFRGWQHAAIILQKLWELSQTQQTRFPFKANSPDKQHKEGKYTSVSQELAIQCSESPNYYPAERFGKLVERSIARSGPIGAAIVWGDEPCSSWQNKATMPYHGPWNHETSNPILVIGNTFDPSTPYEGAIAMTKALAKSRLVTVDGYGHTSLLNPSDCVSQIESQYLLNGTLPNEGTVCRQNQRPF